jgi:hypothetical protein
MELFTEEFRARNPMRRIASWGKRDSEAAKPSAADDSLLDDLRSLGYIQ